MKRVKLWITESIINFLNIELQGMVLLIKVGVATKIFCTLHNLSCLVSLPPAIHMDMDPCYCSCRLYNTPLRQILNMPLLVAVYGIA